MDWGEYKMIKSLACRIINSNWNEIHNVNYRKENVFWDGCQTDIDNHADTHCFGGKFRPITYKFQQCKLSPFLKEYPEKMNIPRYSAGPK